MYLQSSFVVRAVRVRIWTRVHKHVVGHLLGGRAKDLMLEVTLLDHPVTLIDQLVALGVQMTGLLPGHMDLHQCCSLLLHELLDNLRHVESRYQLELIADLLHLMEYQPIVIVLDLLGSLLGGVVDGITLVRTVLEGEVVLGWWILCHCIRRSFVDWCCLWCVCVFVLDLSVDFNFIDWILLFNSI